MGEENVFTMTATCPRCGAGVNLADTGEGAYTGKCPLCSTAITCPADPAEAKED